MTADEGAGIDGGLGEDAQADLAGGGLERGGGAKAIAHLGFCDGPVRLFADGLDVEAEEDVAHSGVADYDDLVDVAAVEAEGAGHVAYLEVDGGEHDLAEFAAIFAAVVGDAVHDVAAAEALGVLE